MSTEYLGAVQPPLPLPEWSAECAVHTWKGRGRWRGCTQCWVRGWFRRRPK